MSRRVRAALAALSFLAASLGAGAAQAFSDIYIFGDSLADSGNNAVIFDNPPPDPAWPFPAGYRTPVPLAAADIIPTAPYASNRYSNGPVWVEYFAQTLGLSATASFLGGTNFAFGGARSGPGFGHDVPWLSEQAGMLLGATGGVAPASALYVVQGGGNDARDVLASGDLALISAYAANVADIVGDLQAAGARDLLIANVPDIGKAPALLALGAGAQGSFVAGAMNAALDAALADLPGVPGTRLFRLDLFGLVNAVYDDPAAFGFADMGSMCAFSQACIDNPAGVFFWDGIHPTTAAHQLLGLQAAALVPEPQTYALLLVGLLLLATRMKKSVALAI